MDCQPRLREAPLTLVEEIDYIPRQTPPWYLLQTCLAGLWMAATQDSWEERTIWLDCLLYTIRLGAPSSEKQIKSQTRWVKAKKREREQNRISNLKNNQTKDVLPKKYLRQKYFTAHKMQTLALVLDMNRF